MNFVLLLCLTENMNHIFVPCFAFLCIWWKKSGQQVTPFQLYFLPRWSSKKCLCSLESGFHFHNNCFSFPRKLLSLFWIIAQYFSSFSLFIHHDHHKKMTLFSISSNYFVKFWMRFLTIFILGILGSAFRNTPFF